MALSNESDPLPPSFLDPEESFRKCVNAAGDELRQLMERWNNRPVVERSWAEQYLNGRISVVLRLQAGDEVVFARFRSVLIGDNLTCGEEGKLTDTHQPISHGDVAILNLDRSRDDQLVLVVYVKLSQAGQKGVPSVVRFDLVNDDVNDSLRRSLYRSAVDGTYQFLPTWVDGEFRPMGSRATGNCYDYKVETSPKIMNRIANEQCGGSRYRYRCVDSIPMKGLLSSLRICVGAHSVSVFSVERCEHLIQLTDVLVGPFDL